MSVTGSEAVGLLGGTFDPVHLGHLRAAQEVRRLMRLPRILLLPTAVPPHKAPEELSPAHHREAMLRLAVGGREGLEICPLELNRDRVSFTIDTLRTLRRESPDCRPLFVLGMDALLQISTWRSSGELVREFDLIVIDRPGQTLSAVRGRLDASLRERIVSVTDGDGSAVDASRPQPGSGGRIFHLPVEPIPISSSEIREIVAAGGSLSGLVPPAVAGYIQRTGLYRQE